LVIIPMGSFYIKDRRYMKKSHYTNDGLQKGYFERAHKNATPLMVYNEAR